MVIKFAEWSNNDVDRKLIQSDYLALKYNIYSHKITFLISELFNFCLLYFYKSVPQDKRFNLRDISLREYLMEIASRTVL